MLRHWLSTGFIKAAMVAAVVPVLFSAWRAEGGYSAQGGPITAGVESGAGGLGGASGADTEALMITSFSLSFLFGEYIWVIFRYKTGFLSD
jgi:hypothetical protein